MKEEKLKHIVEQISRFRYEYNDSMEFVDRELAAEGLLIEGSLVSKLSVLISHLKRRANHETTTC